MHKKEILAKLRELGTLTEIKPLRTPDALKVRKPKEDSDLDLDTPAEGYINIYKEGRDLGYIDTKKNPTLGYKFEPTPITELCECGKVVQNRVVEHKVIGTPVKHWRERCATCNRTRNPLTGKFDLSGTQAYAAYIAYFKDKKAQEDK